MEGSRVRLGGRAALYSIAEIADTVKAVIETDLTKPPFRYCKDKSLGSGGRQYVFKISGFSSGGGSFLPIYRIGFGEGVTTVNLFILLVPVAVISMAPQAERCL